MGPHHHHHRGGFPLSRNVTYFVFIMLLALLGAMFYLYAGAVGEVQLLKREVQSMEEPARRMKTELLDAHSKIEAETAAANECRGESSKAEAKNQGGWGFRKALSGRK